MYKLPELGNQFAGHVQGRTLIIDADGPAYVASATVKTLGSAVRKFQSIILTKLFMAKAENAICHFTAGTSQKGQRFAVLAAKPYQGNRTGKSKPPLLEATRQACAHQSNWLPEYEVIMHHVLEADDGMIIDAYRLGEFGVIDSEDKDLRMTPYPYFCKDKGVVLPGAGFGFLYLKQLSTTKCMGQGLKFFWAQMLMGDTADNIKGVITLNGGLCGPKGTYDALHPLTTSDDCANFVFDAYRKIDQNPIPEGWLLWLRRTEQDTVLHYFNSMNLSKENDEFYRHCQTRNWFSATPAKQTYDEAEPHDDAELGG
jgi:hypothetical protein